MDQAGLELSLPSAGTKGALLCTWVDPVSLIIFCVPQWSCCSYCLFSDSFIFRLEFMRRSGLHRSSFALGNNRGCWTDYEMVQMPSCGLGKGIEVTWYM